MDTSYFRDRVAVVTGAGSGIGRALALALARAGAEVAVCDVDEAGLVGTLDRLAGFRCTSRRVDVADRTAMTAFADAVVRDHGRVHFVFNNAGVDVNAPVAHLAYEDFEWLMNINFWGVVHGCKAFLPHLERAGFGHIVNTSSIFGLITVPNQAAYHAAKFAVRGFSESLRQELEGQGLRVSWVMPGGVRTNVVRNARYQAADNQSPTRDEAIALFDAYAPLSADQAAEEILRGVARNRARILVGRDARLMALLAWLAPVRYPRLLSWLQRRARPGRPKPG
ncbi:MAG: SDR family NAD(P)-dependent oxidoreductase [Pseudomonadales bacterium]